MKIEIEIDTVDIEANIKRHLEEISNELNKNADYLSAMQLTSIWMQSAKVHNALSQAKKKAQERDWKED